jgi:multidrug resistance efflux pump
MMRESVLGLLRIRSHRDMKKKKKKKKGDQSTTVVIACVAILLLFFVFHFNFSIISTINATLGMLPVAESS